MSEQQLPSIARGDEQGTLITQAPTWFTRAIAIEPEVRSVEVEGARVEYVR